MEVLVCRVWREIKKPPNAFQAEYQKLDILPLQIVDEILDAGDNLLAVDYMKLGKLAYVLQVSTSLVIDNESRARVFLQFLVLCEQLLADNLADILPRNKYNGGDSA